ncbi:hypothetical protein FB451DRAFT_1364403 [Mycena latifolia]|nr:hypothetical protein FB451DRAFT_1364403 [Mycena latifolia]
MAVSRCSQCGGPLSSLSEPESNINVPAAPGTLARHQEVLSTNEAPEGAELTFIREVVSKTDAKLADVKKEISRLQNRIQQLQDERASLAIYRAQNTAVLSPLRRMPPEVLGEIFSWTLPSIDEGSRKFHKSHSPWVLTQVCNRWRAVAVSTPSLWSRVVINCFEELNPLSMVKTQIERAHRLQIHFYAHEKKPSRPQIDMFQLLADHSAQWEELVIGLTTAITSLLASLRDRVPSLYKLEVTWRDPASQQGVESIDCFRTASSLIDVVIFNKFRHIPILLPAQQLTRYTVNAPWHVHAGILKLAHSLVDARIDISFENDAWPDSSEPTDLLLLRRLYVSHPNILHYLRTPAVRDITYLLETDEGPGVLLRHLEPFVVRSGCSLQKFCFHGVPVLSVAAEILGKFRSLSELTVITYKPYHYTRLNIFISNLTIPNPTGSTLAPHLLKISFGCSGGSCIDYGRYLHMLQSRWKTNDRALKGATLVTDSMRKPDRATLNGLTALSRDGLDLLLLEGGEAEDVIGRWTMSR